MLNRTGVFAVTPVEHGERALEVVSTQQVDAILTDLQMPVMDGLTLLGHLLERGVHVPVAVMTGQQITPELHHRLQQFGIAASFTKPIEIAVLADELQRSLSPTTVGRLTGVTIFLTGSAGNYAQADISGGATVSIEAPSTGTYRGIAFFQDRNASSGGSPNMFNGGSTMEIKGAIYIPKQEVQFDGGNTSSGGCTKIVAFRIEFTGNSDIDSDCTGYGFDDETRRPPKLME